MTRKNLMDAMQSQLVDFPNTILKNSELDLPFMALAKVEKIAVHVLNKQVEELSAGAISSKAMGMSLSIAVAAAMGLAMVRVLTGISILWFVLPGYIIALGLSFFVPSIFTAIAFDSGGVASGPLTATFMLPFAMGATTALGGNVMTDAFGLVALVAMMPLIVVQVMGAIYVVKTRRNSAQESAPVFSDEGVIELWEVA